MKAILIDPFKREVRIVEEARFSVAEIGEYLARGERAPEGTHNSARATLCLGPRIKFGHHSYVDDDGCYREGQQWFRLHGYPHAIAGYCLILGDRMTVEGMDKGDADTELAPMLPYAIEWVTPENAQSDFPPITISSIDPDTGEQKVISSIPVNFAERREFEKRD